MPIRRWFVIIVSMIALLGLVFSITASGQSLLVYIDRLIHWSGKNEGDQEIIARVNGEPVYRSQLETFELLLSIQGTTPADQVTAKAFGMLVEHVLLQQEAERRGIHTSEAEARAFMEQQRRLWQQFPPSDPAVQAIVSRTMKTAGLSEDEYWERMIGYYARLLNLSKLRQQIYEEVPFPSEEEINAYLAQHPIPSALVFIPVFVKDWGEASVVYADLVRKQKILSLDGLAAEVDRIARQYKPLAPTQPTVESYQFVSLSELPEHAQKALAFSEGEIGLVEDRSGSPVIVLMLSKVLVDEERAKEYASNQLREQRAKEHYQSVVEALLRQAHIEILASDLKSAFPQGLPGFP